MRYPICFCFFLLCSTPLSIGQVLRGFHWKGYSIDVVADQMARDASPEHCMQVKGNVVVHTPSMDLYADELTPTSGCGNFVVTGNVHIKILDQRSAP
jgi:lipopolysaccharide export system protein LptA